MVIQIVLTFIASETNFTHLTFGCEGSVTAFRLLCCVVICLLRLTLFANVYLHFLQSNGVSVSNSDCWSSLTNDLICSVTNSCSASSLTFRWKSWRIVSTCFLSSSTLQRVRKSWLNLPHHYLFYKLIWLYYEMWFGKWFSWFGQNAKTFWDGPDKMPTKKLGRTKSQPQKKSGQNANLWLALCPVGILSGWHFVLPPNPAGYGTRNHYS